MVYTYGEYRLYRIDVFFKNIGSRPMYFFSKKNPKRGTLCDMPEGYEIGLSPKTKMPYLKYAGRTSLHQKKKIKQK